MSTPATQKHQHDADCCWDCYASKPVHPRDANDYSCTPERGCPQMTTLANQPDPLAEFQVGASMDGEMELDHYPPNGQPQCYWSQGIDNGSTLTELAELARKHLAEAHRAVIDGELAARA